MFSCSFNDKMFVKSIKQNSHEFDAEMGFTAKGSNEIATKVL